MKIEGDLVAMRAALADLVAYSDAPRGPIDDVLVGDGFVILRGAAAPEGPVSKKERAAYYAVVEIVIRSHMRRGLPAPSFNPYDYLRDAAILHDRHPAIATVGVDELLCRALSGPAWIGVPPPPPYRNPFVRVWRA